jgi:hypothetical protein
MTTLRFCTDRRPELDLGSDVCQDARRLATELVAVFYLYRLQIKCKAGIRASQEHENLLATIYMSSFFGCIG